MSAAAVLDFGANSAQFNTPRRALDKTGRHRTKGASVTTTTSNSGTRGRNSSKQLQQLFALYDANRELFHQSALEKSLETMLLAKNRPRVTKAISLGLGSLVSSKDQARRIKQLVIFIAVASKLSSIGDSSISLYAQDPTFTNIDEQFLSSLGIHVLKTPSPSELGEAGRMIDDETLVYSPFLTIDAYKQLFTLLEASTRSKTSKTALPILIGDDFDALKLKWEKRTTEHRDVDALIKGLKGKAYQRRAIKGDGFWTEMDSPFPMALYWTQQSPRGLSGRSVTQKGIITSRL